MDNTTLQSMTVTLTNHLAGDSLSLNAAALLVVDDALTVNYNLETGVLTIGGEASVADYQTILQGVQYDNTSQNPDVTPRVIDVVVNDGLTDSAVNTSTISVKAVNDAPVTDLNGEDSEVDDSTAAFTEGDNPVLIAPSATIADVDNTTLQSMTVTLTNHLAGDSLSLNAAALLVVDDALTVNYDLETGVLTIGGEASVADYQTILQGVQYDNTSQNPDVTPRVIDVVVNDGLTDSAVNTSTISVTAVNDAPVTDLNGEDSEVDDSTAAFTEGDNPVLIAPSATIADVDNTTLQSMTVTLTNHLAGDSLSLNAAALLVVDDALTVNYDSGDGRADDRRRGFGRGLSNDPARGAVRQHQPEP